ncbi:hypothetical protein F6X40_01865 [Paraburkholderia sp. UCT31]|uniref:hypothetical protein n=1 Tax=Paraburkholderia sp. UCT31 TaxID=2615209 RepID=UPI001655E098|nr:hypothetical protein [Paraburkholderia sp. UCT31]MBC8735611.1 hypothetical protein [Paraburkholderia sp. UCT31]
MTKNRSKRVFTDEEVRVIRATDVKVGVLACMFSVSRAVLLDVQSRRSYEEVTGDAGDFKLAAVAQEHCTRHGKQPKPLPTNYLKGLAREAVAAEAAKPVTVLIGGALVEIEPQFKPKGTKNHTRAELAAIQEEAMASEVFAEWDGKSVIRSPEELEREAKRLEALAAALRVHQRDFVGPPCYRRRLDVRPDPQAEFSSLVYRRVGEVGGWDFRDREHPVTRDKLNSQITWYQLYRFYTREGQYLLNPAILARQLTNPEPESDQEPDYGGPETKFEKAEIKAQTAHMKYGDSWKG